jgi:hypothetical protein
VFELAADTHRLGGAGQPVAVFPAGQGSTGGGWREQVPDGLPTGTSPDGEGGDAEVDGGTDSREGPVWCI